MVRIPSRIARSNKCRRRARRAHFRQILFDRIQVDQIQVDQIQVAPDGSLLKIISLPKRRREHDPVCAPVGLKRDSRSQNGPASHRKQSVQNLGSRHLTSTLYTNDERSPAQRCLDCWTIKRKCDAPIEFLDAVRRCSQLAACCGGAFRGS